MAVTDLTNTTWIFNEDLIREGVPAWQYNINFTSNNSNYIALSYYNLVSTVYHYMFSYHPSSGTPIAVFDGGAGSTPGTWVNQAYRSIEITGGTDVTNATLITWLQSNAKQVLPPPDDKNLVTYESFEVFKNKLIQTSLGHSSGEWNSAEYYIAGNISYYDNKIYVCSVANIGKLPTDTNYWSLLIDATPVIESALRTRTEELLVTSDGYGLVTDGQGGGIVVEEFVLSNGEIIQLSNNEIFYVEG